MAALLCGCASARQPPVPAARPFQFQTDTFAYANELVWDYGYDSSGHWVAQKRSPKPSYTLHCLVVARSARQFFDHARFAPDEPKADPATYHRLVREVIHGNPRKSWPEGKRVVIPGFANLREFSAAYPDLLKQDCGGAWESYFARGNWRMVFPFTRAQQARVAQKLLKHLRPDHPLVVHLARFPQLSINHTVVIFGATELANEVRFDVYDPNTPEQPARLTFDRRKRTFLLPANHYFPGGRVDVYEMFHRWNY